MPRTSGVAEKLDNAVGRTAKRFVPTDEEDNSIEVATVEAVEQVVPLGDSVSVRLAQLEHSVSEIQRDISDLRYLFQRLNNSLVNGELMGYARAYIEDLDRRVTHIENYLRYITTGEMGG